MICRMISLYLQINVISSNWYTCVPGCTIQWFQTAKLTIIVACCNTLLIFGRWIFCTYMTEHYLIYIKHQIWIQMIKSSIVIHHLNMILNNVLWQCSQAFFSAILLEGTLTEKHLFSSQQFLVDHLHSKGIHNNIRSSPMSLTALEFSCFNLLGHVRDR